MSDVNPGSGSKLVERAKAIILNPKEEWPIIASETTSPGEIFTSYAVPLAAIGPVAALIGGQIFGYGALGFSYRPGIAAALGTAALTYLFALAGLVLLTFIADFLAPRFGGEANRRNAFKLVAYGMTASWVAGIFGLIPSLGFLGLLGLYSLYLYYLGAGPMMKVPQDKAAGFTVVSVIAAAVVGLVLGAISTPIVALFAGSTLSSSEDISGKVTLPGGGTLDLGKAEEATKQLEAAAEGSKTPVAPDKLKQLLPSAIGSWQRTALESSGAGGVGSQAEGTYTSGDKSFQLKIVDMAALGALAGIGSAMGVTSDREDADGYEKTGTVDGHMQTEKWSKGSSSGKFGVMVGNRFMIEAEGSVGSIDELKAAVAAIDVDALEGLGG